MPFEDPKSLTSVDWNDIHVWLTLMWIYIPILLTFALTMLTAYAIIPSLIITGQLKPSAARLKLPLTGFAFLVLVAAVIILAFGMNQTLIIEEFWDRWLF